jgi:hypothetical protein
MNMRKDITTEEEKLEKSRLSDQNGELSNKDWKIVC